MTRSRFDLIADQLAESGWSWGFTQAVIDRRLMWIADAHRDDGQRFVAQAPTLEQAFEHLLASLPNP